MTTTKLRKEFCYLTSEAKDALRVLMAAGITDEDLALCVLELLWPDTSVYQLED